MRALMIGLVGSVLAVGAAGAGECRPGAFSFVPPKGQEFKVQAFGFSGVTSPRYASPARTVLKGTLNRRPYIIDIQGRVGSSTTFSSYAGTKLGEGIAPRWGKLLAPYHHDDEMTVWDGPLGGEWRAVCRP